MASGYDRALSGVYLLHPSTGPLLNLAQGDMANLYDALQFSGSYL
jgi:hypothetical protein